MSFRCSRRRATLFLSLLVFNGLAQAEAPASATPPVQLDEPVATVNGEPISSGELNVMVSSILAKSRPSRRSDVDDAQLQAREDLITNLAQAQEATKLGLERDPGVAAVLSYQRAVTLARAYQREMLRRNPVGDAQVEEEYARGLVGGRAHEFHLAHILLGSRNRAVEIIDQLQRGEKFADLARIYSADGNAPTTGGDMGWMRIDMLDEYQFVDAVKALKPGEYTAKPVKGASGWHVIRLVEAARPIAETPKFADIPANLRDKLKQRATQRAFDQLQADAVARAQVTRAADLRSLGAGRAVQADPPATETKP